MSLLLLLGNSSGGVQPNKLARFNGTTDYATIENFLMPGSEGTLMILCKLDVATPGDGTTGIVDLGVPAAGSHYPYSTGDAYISCFRSSRVGPFALSGSVDRTEWHWFIVRDNAGSGWEFLQGTTAGVLYSCSTQTHEYFSTTMNGSTIGANSQANLFNGDMDRFLLFSTRLSDAQILAVIAGGNGTSPLIRYEFSSNAGGIFADASGNGYDATISGTPTIETV